MVVKSTSLPPVKLLCGWNKSATCSHNLQLQLRQENVDPCLSALIHFLCAARKNSLCTTGRITCV